ncbi:MAG: 3-phosphoshikimate 1-carboxyvinyltransferase [Bdellovibrionia bacterium]
MIEIVKSCSRFKGNPKIPGDKSISHRSLIFGALCEGTIEILDLLESADVQSTARCLSQLGVKIRQSGNRTWVEGMGNRSWTHPSSDLDCGNSGTTIRLLMGLISGLAIQATLTGDSSLVQRPMKRIAEPLIKMGAKITLTREDFAPMTVAGGSLQAVEYSLPVASAQLKTALIIAALSARGTTVLRGKIHSRDHTERMLAHFGIRIESNNTEIRIPGEQSLRPNAVQVPGDPSTAAFWLAAASLIPGAELKLEKVSLNPTRLGFVRVLERMGADLKIKITGENPEPVGTIEVRSAPLKGTRILKEEIPSLVDELPVLAVLASQAQGVTEVEGAEELRVKESDRLEALASNLRVMGVEVEVRADGFRIEGPQRLQGARIKTQKDHRIAMAFSVAGMVANGVTEIEDAECVGVSYPEFYKTLRELTQ